MENGKLFRTTLKKISMFIKSPNSSVCDVSSVDKISDCQLEGPGFESRLGHGVEYLGDLLSPHRPRTGT